MTIKLLKGLRNLKSVMKTIIDLPAEHGDEKSEYIDFRFYH
jgi:hypothetical protein